MTIRMSLMLPLADLPEPEKIVPDGLNTRFMHGYERNILIMLLRTLRAETVIEIGVQRGHCAQLMLEHVPTITHYIGIDVEPGYRTSLPSQQSEVSQCPGGLVLDDLRFEMIVRPNGSHDLAPADLPICDVMLIDGDHSETGVRRDTVLATCVVRPGGFILWHDYWPPFKNDVVRVLDELYEKGRYIRHIPHTWLAMEVN